MNPAELIREYELACRVHDLERVLDCVDDEAVYWFSNQTSHIGKPAIARAIQANFNAIKAEEYRIEDLHWLVRTNDSAVCTYRFVWAGEIDGKPAGGSGRGTCLLINRGGQWLISHEHLSKGPSR
ncbi:MAG: nuclear transport factor 2 family protein [Planctomycetota bacterium]